MVGIVDAALGGFKAWEHSLHQEVRTLDAVLQGYQTMLAGLVQALYRQTPPAAFAAISCHSSQGTAQSTLEYLLAHRSFVPPDLTTAYGQEPLVTAAPETCLHSKV